MEIWAWLWEAETSLRADGHDRLVDLIRALPHHVVDGEMDEVAALAPEALSLAAAARQPWLEVYVRHWWLQSRVTAGHGETVLLEAIDALDKAHTELTVDCPQSVCTVQDLCIAYGSTDGPGYVEERLAVCDETLARIDPSWDCWICITDEKAQALVDGDRFSEARELIEEQTAQLPPVAFAESRYQTSRVRAALGVGRPEEALAAVEAAQARPGPMEGRRRKVTRRLLRAQALMALSRREEAAATLPAPDELDPSDYDVWAETRWRIAGTTADDRALERRWRRQLVDQGAWAKAQRLAALLVRMSVEAGSVAPATRDLACLEAIVARRRRPEREAELVAELARLVEALQPPVVDLPGSPETLLAELRAGSGGGEPVGHETVIERLTAAVDRWPDDDQTLLQLAGTWAVAGDRAMARDLLETRVRTHGTADAARMLGAIMQEEGEQGLRSVEDVIRPVDPVWLDVLWARLHFGRGDWQSCVDHASAVVDAAPDSPNTLRLWAGALVHLGRYEEAIEKTIAARGAAAEVEPNDRWQAIIAASGAGAWAVVRDEAIALGWPYEPGDEPIDEPVEQCRVRFPGNVVETVERTGPATGRVISVALPGRVRRFGWRLLLEPNADKRPDDLDEDVPWSPTYPLVAVLEEPASTSFVVGASWVDQDAWLSLRERFKALGAGLWIHYSGFEITSPDDEDIKREGVWAVLAAPETVPAGDLWALLRDAEWDGPLLSPDLAAAGAEPVVAEVHTRLFSAWGFDD